MYQHHWDTFTTFQLSQLSNNSFPASPEAVALFTIHLSQKKLAIRTIRTYTSAISYIHKINNFPDPASSFLVAKTIQGLQNQNTQSVRSPLLPITRVILHQLIDNIPTCCHSTYHRYMWSALFHLCYHGCLRAGEAVVSSTPEHTLKVHQVQVSQSHITINFKSFKHSGDATPSVTIQADPNPARCPVKALQAYLAVRPQVDGPLFIETNATPIHRTQFTAFLKSVLAGTTLDPDSFNTHSFRIGRATQLAQDNHSQETIRSAGRWKSSAYIRYIRSDNIHLPR